MLQGTITVGERPGGCMGQTKPSRDWGKLLFGGISVRDVCVHTARGEIIVAC